MTDCNGCGRCCDPVAIPATLDEARASLPRNDEERRNRSWMLTHLTPIRRRDGLDRVADYMRRGITDALIGGELVTLVTHFYECDLYDPTTRRCTDWANRPPLCGGFPWYDSPPDDTKALPLECSFRADIGLPVKPDPKENPDA